MSSSSSPHPPTTTITSSPPSHDVRHVISHQDLLTPPLPAKEGGIAGPGVPSSRRPSRLATSASPRLGSRSPGSIPSSPSSVHSSSSAIFERDIEPLPASIFESTINSHHNIHNHQALVLESAVPAVLTSAVTALSSSDDASKDTNISVIAPASSPPAPRQILASAAASSAGASRSPSPTRRNFMMPLPIPPETARPPIMERQSTGPLPPGSFPTAGSPRSVSVSASSSPSPQSLSPLMSTVPLSPPTSITATTSPEQANKRLSFISYSDLLSSAPLAAVPLSSIVAPVSDEPPPHIPAVLGQGTSSNISEIGGEEDGEYVREGFGRGLEARLEQVLQEGQQRQSMVIGGRIGA